MAGMKSALLGLAAALVLVVAPPAQAQSYPSRPIRFVVPYPPGGPLDTVARLLGRKVSDSVRQPVIVENKPGAGGNIGADYVAKSAPDGYTILMGAVATHAINPTLYSHIPYDAAKDFAPVTEVASTPNVLVVNPSLPVSTVKEFIAYAKARPGQLSYAGTSVGSITHLSTELFAREVGIRMEMIPYAGIPAAMSDLLSGRTQFMSTGVIAALPQIKSGQLKPLAILAPKRHPQLPDVPTIVEEGYPDLTVATWFGLLMPAKTPPEIVQRVNTEVMKALQSPDIVEKYRAIGVESVPPNTPAAFGDFLKNEIARWAKVIREANVTVE